MLEVTRKVRQCASQSRILSTDLIDQAQARFPFKEIVTHRFGLDEINAGLRLAESGQAIRVAIYPWE